MKINKKLDKVILYLNIFYGFAEILVITLFLCASVYVTLYGFSRTSIATVFFLLLLVLLFLKYGFSVRTLYILKFMRRHKLIITNYYSHYLLERRGCSLIEKRMLIIGEKYYEVECPAYGYRFRLIVYPTKLYYVRWGYLKTKKVVLNFLPKHEPLVEEHFQELRLD